MPSGCFFGKRGTARATFRLLLLFLYLSFLIKGALADMVDPSETEKEPTCVEKGYRVTEVQGVIKLEELPPLGHSFGDWTLDGEGKTRTHVCQVCGYTETIRVNTVPEADMPRLDLEGEMDGIDKKNRVVLKAAFSGPGESFQCYAIMTLQGHSTFGYPKRNYTIRFYDDPEGNDKHKLVFKNWNREHKYILKANYVDLSQSRNLAGARLWTAMTASRASVPQRIANLPTLGAVDGFPVEVYLNGAFFGLYSLNLHKDDDLYQMEKGAREALLICNSQTTDEALFRAPAAFLPDYSSDWEIEFCGTEDETWAKERFNSLVAFVMDSDDETFRAKLGDHLDVDAAIDYLIFIYSLGLSHSGAKDLVMLNFGDRWIPSAYDMDEAFGLDSNRFVYLQPEEFLPVQLDGDIWDSATGSLLWDRLLTGFEAQIRARYRALRQDVLSEEAIMDAVRGIISTAPESCYDYDYYLYPDRPIDDRDMESQIQQYVSARMPILDRVLGGMM